MSRPPKHPPGYLNMMVSKASKTYTVICLCTNCGERKFIKIPKGTPIPDNPKGEVCDFCGCSDFGKGRADR